SWCRSERPPVGRRGVFQLWPPARRRGLCYVTSCVTSVYTTGGDGTWKPDLTGRTYIDRLQISLIEPHLGARRRCRRACCKHSSSLFGKASRRSSSLPLVSPT